MIDNSRLLNDRILIEQIVEDQHESLFLLDQSRKTHKARVLQVGPGKMPDIRGSQPIQVKIDDIVIYDQSKTIEIIINNKKYFIIDEIDIYAIID